MINYTGAMYRGFATKVEAEDWLKVKITGHALKKPKAESPAGALPPAAAPAKELPSVPSTNASATASTTPQLPRLYVYTDGASRKNPGPGGCGVAAYLIGDGHPDRLDMSHANPVAVGRQYLGVAVTNNQAEYQVRRWPEAIDWGSGDGMRKGV